MNPFIILLSAVISVAAILDSLVFTAPDIFIPEAGVVCDKPKAFCATAQGISKNK
ncbi:MAG: YcgJ family protein, partial [Plesiomonas sp.]